MAKWWNITIWAPACLSLILLLSYTQKFVSNDKHAEERFYNTAEHFGQHVCNIDIKTTNGSPERTDVLFSVIYRQYLHLKWTLPLKSHPSWLIKGCVHFIRKHFIFPLCSNFLQPGIIQHQILSPRVKGRLVFALTKTSSVCWDVV